MPIVPDPARAGLGHSFRVDPLVHGTSRHHFGGPRGGLPRVAMIRPGSVVPAMIAHYITGLVSLGGFISETWLNFFK